MLVHGGVVGRGDGGLTAGDEEGGEDELEEVQHLY